MKNYAVILAGGTGKRMGNVKLPKQFLEIQHIPVIILTIQNILKTQLFDEILIVIHADWRDYLKELLLNYHVDTAHLSIIEGGKERLNSIENALDFLKGVATAKDIVCFCDAVRPFVTHSILYNAVEETKKYGATVAVCPVKDTMMVVKNDLVTDMPPRTTLFHGQAPDSFEFKLIYDSVKKLTPAQRQIITGTAQICQLNDIPIHTFMGDERNIKITTIMDMFLANAIYKEMYN